jgi:hypothetical protein
LRKEALITVAISFVDNNGVAFSKVVKVTVSA